MTAYSILLFLGVVTLSQAAVPLFAWSDTTYFQSKGSSHANVAEFVEHRDFINAMASIMSSKPVPSALSSVVSDQQEAPEVIISFVAPMMNAGQLSQKDGLKALADRSASILAVSYATPNDMPFSEALAHVVTEQQGSAQYTSCTTLESLDTSVFSNGATDLLHITDSDPDAACLSHVTDVVSKATQGKFVAVYTADMDSRAQFELLSTSTTENTNTTHQSVVYITPDILTGLLIAIPMIFMVIGPCMAMMAIHTPPRMSKAALVPTKEY